MTQVLHVGAGMIAHDQIVPSLLHMQRSGAIGDITVVSQNGKSVQGLKKAPLFARAFPGQMFRCLPEDASGPHPELYKQAIGALPPGQIVIAAVPDQLHFDVVMTALHADQNVICVKPLVLRVKESMAIEEEARARGRVVAVEYHKRFDDRSQMARRRYKDGLFGNFKLGSACLMEKWYYRHSNFQNWCTLANSDAFTYIGCHYVDLVHFITGLLPTSVSVYGIIDKYPNGNEGYLWTDARVIWENGACLNVQNSLSFPDAAPGTNTQGLTMYCGNETTGAWLEHSDQYRGLRYAYIRDPGGDGATQFAEPSPDYMQYIDLGGPGLVPVGYGYRSVEHLVKTCLNCQGTLEQRRAYLADLDAKGVVATPANSRYNELVTEAGRLSIENCGREVAITYGKDAGVAFRY